MPKIGLHTLAGKKEAEMSTKEKLWFVLELFKLLLEDTEIYKDIESMLTGASTHYPDVLVIASIAKQSQEDCRVSRASPQ